MANLTVSDAPKVFVSDVKNQVEQKDTDIPLNCYIQILTTCHRLVLKLPKLHLIQLPGNATQRKSVMSANGILFEKKNNDTTILMVHQKWKKGNCAFPGGFRAGAPEDNYSTASPQETEDEEFFPLLTAARELSEEIPFVFQNSETNTESSEILKKIYNFLNKEETKTIKNSGWNQKPVLAYVCQLTQDHSKRIDQALEGKIKIANDEVLAISRISLITLKEAFARQNWTKEGLEARVTLINLAAERKEQADLKGYEQYAQPITLKNTLGQEVVIADYTARTIFNSLDEIEETVK